ncbi:MAG: SH3 domain-containing protein [Oscillospiraceae bacterium]|nr:SH3 domain-containing protein [Oscillospiraceae bacterium]
MKKSISLLLIVITLLSLAPMTAKAATMDSKAGAVTTVSGSLNVRSSASTASRIVSTLRKGSYITLISKSGSWWKVEYGKNLYGYCHADYITVVEGTPATVATQSGSLNVRSGAGTNYAVQAQLAKGETVLRLTEKNGWTRVLYHGTKTGYVSSKYLSGSVSSSGYGAVSLRVPSYKQNDSRWANVKLGASGKTISQIGCATTAIAMMESYRTGTTIYPDAMSKKLSYTSSGSVYWPSHFVTVTSSSGYLNGIYQQLKQGKPVLLGMKNSYGGQHWVVITGFTGGSLSAANFTINDPGSNSRTTLQQFLNAYPTFYKYFYY